MSDQYVPALRRRFLEDMQIKGLQSKTQTMYLRGMRDYFHVVFILPSQMASAATGLQRSGLYSMRCRSPVRCRSREKVTMPSI
jgi:hypothetical protein